MSILVAAAAASTAATAPVAAPGTPLEPITAVNVIVYGLFLAWGLGFASVLGAFRADTVNGPVRLAPDTRASRVLLLLGAGVLVWFGMQVLYGIVMLIEHKLSGAPEPWGVESLGARDYAILATLPYLVALFFLIVGARLSKPTLLRELGWSLDRLGIGVAIALLASVAVVPLMTGAGGALEMLYRAVGFHHPSEHELLKVLGESHDRASSILIIIGATLLAPLFEEFLFRGLLQTLLLRAFTPRPRVAAPVAQAVGVTEGVTEGGDLGLALPAFEPVPSPVTYPAPSPAARWAAIAITAFLFALLHPTWTWPLIFLLALALGYAYERTGNLWVPITMHLVFNTVQTAFFLLARSL
jgi:membrane protease YdiL (CAAX protease family)